MYQGQDLVVHKLTESKCGIRKFGIRKFGIRIEIRSLMYAGIGCIICSYLTSWSRRRRYWRLTSFFFKFSLSFLFYLLEQA